MKKLFTALIIVLIAGLVLVGAAVANGVDFSDFSSFINSDDKYTQATYTATGDLTELDITVENRDVKISHADQDKITITYYYEEKDTITIDEDTSGLTFKQSRTFIYSWFNWGIVSSSVRLIDIVVPNDVVAVVDVDVASGDIDISGAFNDVELNSASGDLDVANITASKLSAITLSGEVTFQTVTATEDVYGSTASGDVFMSNSTCSAIVELRTASGDSSMLNSTAGNDVVLFSMSGTVSANGVNTTGKINAQTSSGTASIVASDATDYYARTMSGSVVINLPKDDSEYDFNLSTTSGSVQINSISSGRSYVGGDGTIPVYGSTASGNVNVTTL